MNKLFGLMLCLQGFDAGDRQFDEQSLLGPVAVQLVQHVLDLPAGDGETEMIGGDLFQRVSLIEHNHVVVGQHARSLAPQRKVRKEQRMVHYEYIGVPDATAGAIVEAALVSRAGLSQTVAVLAANLIPYLRQRFE